MRFKVVFLLLFGFCNSAPHEGLPLLNPGGIGGIFKGPGSETIIRGPDGSEITSEQKGGAVVRDDSLDVKPIVVAEPEIIASSPAPAPILASAAPVLVSAAPILASPPAPLLTGETYAAAGPELIEAAPIQAVAQPIDVKPIEIVEQDPHIIETEIVEAPDVEPDQSSDLKGPSGRIITKGSASVVSGPASTTITEPRKILIAPPKIALGDSPSVLPYNPAPLPPVAVPEVTAVAAQTVAPLPAVSYEVSSTIAPPVALGYSSTIAPPVALGYSTTAAPLVSSTGSGFDSSRINLGAGINRQSIPVVEYSASNGVLNGQSLAAIGAYSSTEAPILSSSISAVTTDRYTPSTGPAVPPSSYLSPPQSSANLAPTAAAIAASSSLANIQKIPRPGDNIAVVDGRVDMGYPVYRKPTYQLPHVLSEALTKFYEKPAAKDKDTVVIDDKMGELSQNEISSYDPRQDLRAQQKLSREKYLGPALSNSRPQINFAPVSQSEVIRLSDVAYQSQAIREIPDTRLPEAAYQSEGDRQIQDVRLPEATYQSESDRQIQDARLPEAAYQSEGDRQIQDARLSNAAYQSDARRESQDARLPGDPYNSAFDRVSKISRLPVYGFQGPYDRGTWLERNERSAKRKP